jgi:hypothetical protein
MRAALRILFAAAAYVVGVIMTGMLVPVLRLPAFTEPPGADPAQQFLWLCASAPLFALALTPLADGLRGSWRRRWLALASLLYVTIGLNTMIELKIFSHLLNGSAWAASLYSLLPSMLAAAVLTKTSRPQDPSPTLRAVTPGVLAGLSGRLLLAWLAFPLGYWIFGMLVAPVVVPIYEASKLGIFVPPPSLVFRTQLLRGALLLAATLPSVLLWDRSRARFVVAMGLAQTFAIGVFPLLQATFMPATLRIVHSLEIAANAFLFAAVVGALFIRPQPSADRRLELRQSA